MIEKDNEMKKVVSLVSLLITSIAFIIAYVMYEAVIDERLESATKVTLLMIIYQLLV